MGILERAPRLLTIILIGTFLLTACSGGSDSKSSPADNPNFEKLLTIKPDGTAEFAAKVALDASDFVSYLAASNVFGLASWGSRYHCASIDRSEQDPATSKGSIKITFDDCTISKVIPQPGFNSGFKDPFLSRVWMDGSMQVKIIKAYNAKGNATIMYRYDISFNDLKFNTHNEAIHPFLNCADHRNTVLARLDDEDDRNILGRLLNKAEQYRKSDNRDHTQKLAGLIAEWKTKNDEPTRVAYELLAEHAANTYEEHYRYDGDVRIKLFPVGVSLGRAEALSNLTMLNQKSGKKAVFKKFALSWNVGRSASYPSGYKLTVNDRELIAEGTPTPRADITILGKDKLKLSRDRFVNQNNIFNLTGDKGRVIALGSFKDRSTGAFYTKLNVYSVFGSFFKHIPTDRLGNLNNQSVNACKPVLVSSNPGGIFNRSTRLRLMNAVGSYDPDHNFIHVDWSMPVAPPIPEDADPENYHTFTRTGPVTATARIVMGGDFVIKVAVSDGKYSVSREFPLHSLLAPPSFLISGPAAVNAGETIELQTAVAAGYEGELSYSILASAGEASIDAESGLISWTPEAQFFGGNIASYLSVAVSNQDSRSVERYGVRLSVKDYQLPTVIAKQNINTKGNKFFTGAVSLSSAGSGFFDLNGDGDDELLYANADRFIYAQGLNGNGEVDFSWASPFRFYSAKEKPYAVRRLKKADGDALLVLTVDGGLNGSLRVVTPNSSAVSAGQFLGFDTSTNLRNRLFTADLKGDGDGDDEVIYLSSKDPKRIRVFDHNLIETWNSDVDWYGRIVVGNVDDDPALEVVALNGVVIDGDTGIVQWREDGGFGGELALANVDGNSQGRKEIVSLRGTEMYRWYYYEVYNEVLDEYEGEFKRNENNIPLPMTIKAGDLYQFIDVDGDNIDELIWASGSQASISRYFNGSYQAYRFIDEPQAKTALNIAIVKEGDAQFLTVVFLGTNNQLITATVNIDGEAVNWSNASEPIIRGNCKAVPNDFVSISFSNCDVNSAGTIYSALLQINADGSYQVGEQLVEVSSGESSRSRYAVTDADKNNEVFGDTNPEVFIAEKDDKDYAKDNSHVSFGVYDFTNNNIEFDNIDKVIGYTRAIHYGDINGDGEIELIAYKMEDRSYSKPSLDLRAYDRDGNLMALHTLVSSAGNINAYTVATPDLWVEDMNGDGRDEVFVLLDFGFKRELRVYSFQNGAFVKVGGFPFYTVPTAVRLVDVVDNGTTVVIDGVEEYREMKEIAVVVRVLKLEAVIGFDYRDIYILKATQQTGTENELLSADISELAAYSYEGLVTSLTVQQDDELNLLLLGMEDRSDFYIKAIDARSGETAWQSNKFTTGIIRQIDVRTDMSDPENPVQRIHVTGDSGMIISE